MIILQNERLRVEIAEPGEGRNKTFRFDRAAFITQVTLDGIHQFCTVEPDNLSHPCTGGAGLCSEIKCDSPVAEASVGGLFPKFGVGLFKKPDEQPYILYRNYECEPFDISVECSDTSAVFYTKPRLCEGYSLEQIKTASISDSTLTVEYYFKNTGKKRIKLGEYVHNFITIDRLPLGEGYYLSFPTTADQSGKKITGDGATLVGKGTGFTFAGYSNQAAMSGISRGEIESNKPFSWVLTHHDSPASIEERTTFIPDAVPIWVIDHMISAECFHNFEIGPDEIERYTRTWIFRD